jgi:CBS domain-containing protein
MKQVLVQDIMTKEKDIVKISAFAPVRELLQVMEKRRVRSVVVERMGPHDAYGIVTYVNILRAIYQEDGDMDLLNVYDIASKPLIQIVPQLDIKYAAQLMVKYNRTRLSVTWEGRIVGLITMSDIAKVLMAEAIREQVESSSEESEAEESEAEKQ